MSAVTASKRDVAFGWRFIDAAVAVGRKVKLRRARGGLPYALLLPSLLLVGMLAAGLVYLAWLSFHRFDPFLAKQGSASLENYRRLGSGVGADYYRQTLIRTVITSLAVTGGAGIAAGSPAPFVGGVPTRGGGGPPPRVSPFFLLFWGGRAP